jgi:hypothetical protein
VNVVAGPFGARTFGFGAYQPLPLLGLHVPGLLHPRLGSGAGADHPPIAIPESSEPSTPPSALRALTPVVLGPPIDLTHAKTATHATHATHTVLAVHAVHAVGLVSFARLASSPRPPSTSAPVSGVRSVADDASIPVGTRDAAIVVVVAVGDRGDRVRRCAGVFVGSRRARGGRSVVRTGPDSSQVELRECTTYVYVW